MVKEASKVFKSLPVMMVWPLLALFFQLILLGCGMLALWWVLGAPHAGPRHLGTSRSGAVAPWGCQ